MITKRHFCNLTTNAVLTTAQKSAINMSKPSTHETTFTQYFRIDGTPKKNCRHLLFIRKTDTKTLASTVDVFYSTVETKNTFMTVNELCSHMGLTTPQEKRKLKGVKLKCIRKGIKDFLLTLGIQQDFSEPEPIFGFQKTIGDFTYNVCFVPISLGSGFTTFKDCRESGAVTPVAVEKQEPKIEKIANIDPLYALPAGSVLKHYGVKALTLKQLAVISILLNAENEDIQKQVTRFCDNVQTLETDREFIFALGIAYLCLQEQYSDIEGLDIFCQYVNRHKIQDHLRDIVAAFGATSNYIVDSDSISELMRVELCYFWASSYMIKVDYDQSGQFKLADDTVSVQELVERTEGERDCKPNDVAPRGFFSKLGSFLTGKGWR